MRSPFKKSKILLWAKCQILPVVEFYLSNTTKKYSMTALALKAY